MLSIDQLIKPPKNLSTKVVELCNILVPMEQPIYIPVKTDPNARPINCFLNVKDKIKRDGGQIQYGWTIWKLQNVFVQAEFHAVWVSDAGELIDISPRPEGEKEILFLRDNSRTFTGKFVPNVILPYHPNETVNEYIRLDNDISKIREAYDIEENGVTYYSEEDYLRKGQTENEILALYPKLIRMVSGPDNLCPCESGKKFKKCCGASVY